MAIELYSKSFSKTEFTGSDTFNLTDGQHLKIEVSPNGEDILDYVAMGNCSVYVSVIVTY